MSAGWKKDNPGCECCDSTPPPITCTGATLCVTYHYCGTTFHTPNLVGATVVFKYAGATVATGVTDANGKVCFSIPHDGTYTLVMTPPSTYPGVAGDTRTVTLTCAASQNFTINNIGITAAHVCIGCCDQPVLVPFNATFSGGSVTFNDPDIAPPVTWIKHGSMASAKTACSVACVPPRTGSAISPLGAGVTDCFFTLSCQLFGLTYQWGLSATVNYSIDAVDCAGGGNDWYHVPASGCALLGSGGSRTIFATFSSAICNEDQVTLTGSFPSSFTTTSSGVTYTIDVPFGGGFVITNF